MREQLCELWRRCRLQSLEWCHTTPFLASTVKSPVWFLTRSLFVENIFRLTFFNHCFVLKILCDCYCYMIQTYQFEKCSIYAISSVYTWYKWWMMISFREMFMCHCTFTNDVEISIRWWHGDVLAVKVIHIKCKRI